MSKRSRPLKKRQFATDDDDFIDDPVVHPDAIVYRQSMKKKEKKKKTRGSQGGGHADDMPSSCIASQSGPQIHRDDEDACVDRREMEEYVEGELEKRLGWTRSRDVGTHGSLTMKSVEEMALEAAPKKPILQEDPLNTGMGMVEEVDVDCPIHINREATTTTTIARHSFPKTFK